MTKKAGCFYPQQRGEPPPIQRRSRWRRLDAPWLLPSAEGERFRRSGGLPPQARLAADGQAGHCRRPAAGARGGKGTIRCPCPLLFSPVNTGTPGRRRRPLPTPSEGVNLASSGTPLDRRKGLPPADDKVFKDLQSLLQRLFLKSLAFHPAVRYNKTTRRGKAFTSRISLTALSPRERR